MFDAKSILEGLVRGASPGQTAGQSGGGGLGDILGQVLGGAQGRGGAATPNGQTSSGDYGGIGDILGQLGRAAQESGERPVGAGTPTGSSGAGWGDILAEIQKQLGQGGTASPRSAAAPGSPDNTQAGGGLGDLLNQIKDQIGQAGAGATGKGGIMDVLGQVLAQATQGAKEGATKVGEATGAKDALGRAGAPSLDDIMAQLKDLAQNNPMAAGTAAGGLGGLVLGTQTGRALAGSAARIGALALIGGLAYKAFQNYQAGKPLIAGAEEPTAAPQGSGFEPGAVTNESAALYIRGMIAAAAADGRVDDAEQAKLVGSLKQAGVDAEAEEFLANELNSPSTVKELAGAVRSPEEGIQLYTAARIAIDPDQSSEQRFMKDLAQALGIDPKLAAHIDSTARRAAAA